MKWRVVWLDMKTGVIRHSKPISHRNAVAAAIVGGDIYKPNKHWVEEAYKLQSKVES